MKKIRSMVMASAVVIFLASCSAVAHIEKDETVNFDNYKTFTWVEDETDSKKFLNDIQEKNLQAAVNNELLKANWKESPTKPDVILKHDVLVERNIRETKEPVYSRDYTRLVYNPYTRRWVQVYYPSRFLGYDENQYQVKEGKITITMLDAKTNKVIWQGWTVEDVDRDITSKDLKAGVKSIFKKFDIEK